MWLIKLVVLVLCQVELSPPLQEFSGSSLDLLDREWFHLVFFYASSVIVLVWIIKEKPRGTY